MRGLLIVSIFLAACQPPKWANELLGDAPPKPPIAIVLACDHSGGSTCGQVELAANIEAALQVAASRPHSTIALWSMGGDVGSIHELTHVEVPEESTRGDRARVAQQRAWIEASRTELLRASKTIFSTAQLRASPIAAAISAIALSRHGPVTIVFATDSLESTRETFDFECKKLPDAKKFLVRLKALSLLAPGSLANTHVIFANARITEVGENRCPTSIARIASVRSLWTTAITNAGGNLTITTDAVSPTELGGAQ